MVLTSPGSLLRLQERDDPLTGGDDVSIDPLLCAGLIDWRSLVMADDAERLGIYGFGVAGHIVANLTRQDGLDFFKIVPQAGIRTQTTAFPLVEANEVLEKLRTGQILGAAVLQPWILDMTTSADAQTSIDAGSRVQQFVFAFLTDPATHPRVRRIDTHAASVFLEGERALKIKRAVRFPYLDYSTLAKRKAACDQEMAINRRFAPQIYHRVVPITQDSQGSLSIDGEGTPVEFAIEMTRFDESRTVDLLAEAGLPDADLVAAIADAIAASHLAAPSVPAEPWIQSIPAIIADNTGSFRTAACFPERDIDDLGEASHSAFGRIRGLLEQRGRAGFVRRCHGDLHLANIVLIEEKPVLFDAIEFDPTIASTDVLYDLAFPSMDFIRYDRLAVANGLLNRYLCRTRPENLDALGTLSLFMSLRAAIRSKVLLARLGPTCRDEAEIRKSARVYFELARRLIQPAAPILVAIGGLSGTGKSVLARALAPYLNPEPGAVVLRSDVLRKQILHVNETDRLPESAYQPEITWEIYETLGKQAIRIVSQGHSVVVDAVFADQTERTAISDDASKSGVRFVGLYLQTDLATRQRRVGTRRRDASDATPEIAALQEQYDIGAVDWTLIDASGTPEQTLKLCRSAIALYPAFARPTSSGEWKESSDIASKK